MQISNILYVIFSIKFPDSLQIRTQCCNGKCISKGKLSPSFKINVFLNVIPVVWLTDAKFSGKKRNCCLGFQIRHWQIIVHSTLKMEAEASSGRSISTNLHRATTKQLLYYIILCGSFVVNETHRRSLC